MGNSYNNPDGGSTDTTGSDVIGDSNIGELDCVSYQPDPMIQEMISGVIGNIRKVEEGTQCNIIAVPANGCSTIGGVFPGMLTEFQGRAHTTTTTHDTYYNLIGDGQMVAQISDDGCEAPITHTHLALKGMNITLDRAKGGEGLFVAEVNGNNVRVDVLRGNWNIVSQDGARMISSDDLKAGITLKMNSDTFTVEEAYYANPEERIQQVGILQQPEESIHSGYTSSNIGVPVNHQVGCNGAGGFDVGLYAAAAIVIISGACTRTIVSTVRVSSLIFTTPINRIRTTPDRNDDK
ncbi:hypothetical protein CVV38_02050 [Candidatus Peregrinibacteria bacterium HGW-Peregrinibacteria-1]|jgi:hypothetical protein|nr:MAG: hypothetical protein CVV38_02050 [Candidatus Peregrinibacteria bacterium HGW-Peregrinibacteria-1]